MLRFIKNISLFSSLLMGLFFGIFLMADGTTDAYYLRFTTPKQKALIIGSSRSAQGMQPKIFDSILKPTKFYNYSFTILHAPYGEVYYNSIVKKTDTINAKGPFIICVNPWTLAKGKSENEEAGKLREKGSFLDKTYFVNSKPNIEYFIESFNDKYIGILTNKNRKGVYETFFLNDDGWLEVTIESDMISKELRTENKIKRYKERLKLYSGISKYRLNYLEKTINFFKKFGDVYIVRLPVIDGMLDLENVLIKNFNEEMELMSIKTDIQFFNLMPDNYKYNYIDGNHLDIESGKKASIEIAKKILTNKEKKH